MHSKINISQLQEEIRLRPPHMITPEELRPGGGATAADSADTQAHFTLGIDFFKSYILYNTVLRIVFAPCLFFFCPFTCANHFALKLMKRKICLLLNLPTALS